MLKTSSYFYFTIKEISIQTKPYDWELLHSYVYIYLLLLIFFFKWIVSYLTLYVLYRSTEIFNCKSNYFDHFRIPFSFQGFYFSTVCAILSSMKSSSLLIHFLLSCLQPPSISFIAWCFHLVYIYIPCLSFFLHFLGLFLCTS